MTHLLVQAFGTGALWLGAVVLLTGAILITTAAIGRIVHGWERDER